MQCGIRTKCMYDYYKKFKHNSEHKYIKGLNICEIGKVWYDLNEFLFHFLFKKIKFLHSCWTRMLAWKLLSLKIQSWMWKLFSQDWKLVLRWNVTNPKRWRTSNVSSPQQQKGIWPTGWMDVCTKLTPKPCTTGWLAQKSWRRQILRLMCRLFPIVSSRFSPKFARAIILSACRRILTIQKWNSPV